MGTPMIAGKVAMVAACMTLAFAIWLAVLQSKNIEKCQDAGGVYVSTVCVNPSAIIEVK